MARHMQHISSYFLPYSTFFCLLLPIFFHILQMCLHIATYFLPCAAYFLADAGFTICTWVKTFTSADWSRIFDFGNGPQNNDGSLAELSGSVLVQRVCHITTNLRGAVQTGTKNLVLPFLLRLRYHTAGGDIYAS